MRLSEVARILNAKVVCCEELLDTEVVSACGSDMMSDVLAFVKEQAILLTGLINPQVIRTALMMDMKCVIFVRGKAADSAIINLAKQNDIVLMTTSERMYSACGKLYSGGLNGSAV